MKPTLQLKLSQQLKLTPQLQQSIRLLQLSTIELNEEIERIAQENPLLEIGDEWEPTASGSESVNDESADFPPDGDRDTAVDPEERSATGENVETDAEWSPESLSNDNTVDDDRDGFQIPDRPVSLREYLNSQNCLRQISEYDKKIIGLLIDSLDDDGYLNLDLNELLALLPEELGISIVDLENALRQLQYFDPPGIGARNLKECLVLQLQALSGEIKHRDQAITVVREYLETLASRDFAQLKKRLPCDDQSLREIQKLISRLNPKPGAQYGSSAARYIVPDITVAKKHGKWIARLNPNALPRLNINHLYVNLLKQEYHPGHSLMHQLNEAKWLIKNIHQRANTILNVASAIVERQQQFFEHGEVAMRPLVLRDIADTLGLHESTVSRVTTQKFMYTPRGIFELKYFFGSHVATDSGGACSATAIRALIKQLIQEEDPKKPLSDNKISDILEQQGIVVARRTIAKYREALQIPPANLRKSF